MLIYSISDCNELDFIPTWVEWIELRTDLDFELYSKVTELTDYKLIITERSFIEGGNSKRNFEDRLNNYCEYSKFENVWFDIEINAIKDTSLLDNFSKKLILSYHGYNSYNRKYVESLIKTATNLNPAYIKIAHNLDSFTEALNFFNISSKYPDKLILVGMGKYSKLLRLLYKHLNATATYVVSDSKETVTGQITLSEVKQFRLNIIDSTWQWGGILGGKQVYNSKGLAFYNNHFIENKIKAFYLPIHIHDEDIKEFFDFINSIPTLKNQCYGFSVTMPFKNVIPKIINNDSTMYNLLIWQDKFYNTDSDAFKILKRKIDKLPVKNILIYGSGNMSKLALEVFSEYNISITARNQISLNSLKKRFPKIELIDQINDDRYFDLLINTSPLGLYGEDFVKITGIKNFRFVIDLPYSKEVIPLTKCVEKDSYFSGSEFWKYQAERQLKLFKRSIENGKSSSIKE